MSSMESHRYTWYQIKEKSTVIASYRTAACKAHIFKSQRTAFQAVNVQHKK